MISIAKFRNGIHKYLERELIASMGGWQKWVFGAGAALLLNRFETIMTGLQNNPIIKMMDVIDGDQINIEALYVAFREQAQTTPAVIEIPGMGTIKMSATDIDLLYNAIMEA